MVAAEIGLNHKEHEESGTSNVAGFENLAPIIHPIHENPNNKNGGSNVADFQSCQNSTRHDIHRATDLLVSVSAGAEIHKSKIIDLAFAASEELIIMAQERQDLWIFDVDTDYEVLNGVEYKRRFASLDPTLEEIIRVISSGETSDFADLNQKVYNGGCISAHATESLDSEASRAMGIVFRDPVNLVNMFLDVNKWSSIFCNIVSKAKNLGVLSTGDQGYLNLNGFLACERGSITFNLQMVAEFHVPSPLVKTRETYFVRYSRQIDFKTWVVTDVSLESILPNNQAVTCQRRPSGCIIQALPDGLSTVTWVEHNAVCYSGANDMFRGLLTSGFAFSAKRWISSLERRCDRIATQESQFDFRNLPMNNGVSAAARNGLLKLAERMVRCFHANISSKSENVWRPLPIYGSEEILIKTSSNLEEHWDSFGNAVTIAASVRLPVKQLEVFNFLRIENNRQKWDILSYGVEIRDAVRISSARNSTDCISLVAVEPPNSNTAITYLQESFNDSTSYYVVYAPIDVPTMHNILQGRDVDSVAVLPSGFTVLPDRSPNENVNSETGSSILTIAFNIMDEKLTNDYLPPESVLTASRLMRETISRICTALLQNL